MCAHCIPLRAELLTATSAAQINRIRTLIRTCEHRAANPIPAHISPFPSEALIGAMAQADPNLPLD